MAKDARRDHVRGRQGKSFHDALGDGLAVDCLRERAAHAQVLEGIARERPSVLARDARRMIAVLIQVQENGAPRHRLLETEVGIPAEPGEVRGWHVLDRIQLSGKQRSGAHRIAGQDVQRHFFPRQPAAPVFVVSRELDAAAAHKTHQPVRARADGGATAVKIRAGGVCGSALRDDLHFRQVLRNAAVGRRGPQPDRVTVDDLLGDDRPDVRCEAPRAALDVERALK